MDQGRGATWEWPGGGGVVDGGPGCLVVGFAISI